MPPAPPPLLPPVDLSATTRATILSQKMSSATTGFFAGKCTNGNYGDVCASRNGNNEWFSARIEYAQVNHVAVYNQKR